MFLQKKLTMRNAIIMISTFCTILALVLLTVFFYLTSRSQISEESNKESTETLERMETEINSQLHSWAIQMQTIYTETGLMNRMLDKQRGLDVSFKSYYWTASKFANNRFSTSDGLVAVYIYDCNNSLISSNRKTVTYYPHDIFDDAEMTNSSKILEYIAEDSTDMFVTGYYNEEAGKNIIRLVLKLHDYSDEQVEYGYLVCDFDSSVFSSIMQKYISADNVILWIQPENDGSIAMIGNSEEGSVIASELIETISVSEDKSQIILDEEYGTFYLTHVDFENYNLGVYMLTPMSLVLATQSALFRTLILTVVLMMALTILLSSSIAMIYTRSIEDMQKTVYRIRNGETELRVKPDGMSQELELLGTEFNALLDQINVMIAKQYENQLLMERTEYQALQAQINPHFLYNTLDTMSGIANSQGCTMVSDLCQSLSAIFRYSLDISDRPSTMEQEIVHVRNYAYVMNVRNGGSIDFEYEVDSEVLADQIPRITLQPIVENAINHGLRYVRGRDKRITIKAFHVKDDKEELLQVEISDNGVGMDTEVINRELEKNSIDRVEMGESIGILNVNARIKKAFGAKYGLVVKSEINRGTMVIITLPVRVEIKM